MKHPLLSDDPTGLAQAMSAASGRPAPLAREEAMLLGGAVNAVTLAGAAAAVWAAWRARGRGRSDTAGDPPPAGTAGYRRPDRGAGV